MTTRTKAKPAAKRSSQPDLSVEIAGYRFKNPIWTASGTCGYGEELDTIFDLNRLGAIVTKSITRQPRAGHRPPRCAEGEAGMLNAIGLANVGVEKYVAEKLRFLNGYDIGVIVNVAGFSFDEYIEVCAMLADQPRADMIELNISCPNIDSGGIEFGSDPKQVERIVAEVKKVFPRPVIPKLSPNVTDIAGIARAAEAGGADAIALINTLIGMTVDIHTRRPTLSNNRGGLSGPAIKPVALAMVNKVYEAVTVPVIGIGGASNFDDVVQFMLCGASAVQLGTALFVQPDLPVRVEDDLKKYLKQQKLSSV
ncbi:MAG TPA: dihydroorotate dehydrogenase, partial [candidate division Zixibacteria bacterium]|nr:dihydroorotate dehydrogenase [candidate division Zixibacteria bacterium]